MWLSNIRTMIHTYIYIYVCSMDLGLCSMSIQCTLKGYYLPQYKFLIDYRRDQKKVDLHRYSIVYETPGSDVMVTSHDLN